MSAESRRRAYLQALQIDVYALRGAEPVEAIDAAPVAVDVPPADWDALRDAVIDCRRCALHETRTQTVFGVGNQSADWMIVGEAPGQEEDRRGEPFVGRAGKMLDEMLLSLDLDRGSVFIANILKCRPPNNRDPQAGEAASCRSYLERQIDLLAPRIIIAVGRIAAQHLLNTDEPIGRMRGKQHMLEDRQIPVVVTYHPAYLLRSPTQKRKVWQDLLMAQRMMVESNQ